MASEAPFHGRTAVVTGGGRGIGLAVAAELARLGAGLVLMGRDAVRLAAAAAELSARPGTAAARAITCDVADSASVAAAFAEAVRLAGPVAILVNNAGVSPAAPFLDSTEAEWRRTFEINVTGAWRCCRQVLPGMLERGSGRIVNIASTAAHQGYAGVSAYAASKHALLGLTRSLALETAGTGVTVNAVSPGYVDTDMAAAAVDNLVRDRGLTADAARARLAKGQPAGRLLRPEEVASVVAWLCRPEARLVTGQSLPVAAGPA